MTENQLHSLQKSLPKIKALVWQNRELVEGEILPTSFIVDGKLKLSAEEGDGLLEYYAPQGWPYIHPELEEWATKKGGFLEWQNPGCVVFYKN